MISPENLKLLQGIRNSVYGKALQEFLDAEYDIINDVSACKNWEDTVGRQHAIKTLEKIFSFMKEEKATIIVGKRGYE